MRQMRGMGAGFTLLEFLVVLVVVGVLIGTAWPAFARFVDGMAVEQKSAALRSVLRTAREEAMRRGESVSVCARAQGDGPQGLLCAAAGAEDWSNGWLLFVDRGERGMLDGQDALLQAEQSSAQDLRLLSSAHHLSFLPNGLSANAAANFRLWGRTQAQAPLRLLCVSKTGKLRVAPGATCS